MPSFNDQTTNVSVVETPPVKASWHKNNAERISEILHMIPPRENPRTEQMFYEYRVLDSLHARVLIVEWYEDDYTVDQVPEGIRFFTPGFTCGFIAPTQESRVADMHNAAVGSRWRASMITLHGTPKITIMSMGDGHYAERLRKIEQWATMIGWVNDKRIQNGMIEALLTVHPDHRTTFLDFLEQAHDIHVTDKYHGHFSSEPSVVTLF